MTGVGNWLTMYVFVVVLLSIDMLTLKIGADPMNAANTIPFRFENN
jgi:hypothetical protein